MIHIILNPYHYQLSSFIYNSLLFITILVPIQQSDATTYPGTVTISEKATPSTGALYITVRSDVGLWEAGVRNYKPPAVMVKKIPIDNVGIPL